MLRVLTDLRLVIRCRYVSRSALFTVTLNSWFVQLIFNCNDRSAERCHGAFADPLMSGCPTDMALLSVVKQNMPDLERLSRAEGKVSQLSLLPSPLTTDAAVPDNHLPATLVEARIKVEGQVTSHGQIHRDPKNTTHYVY